MDLKVQYRHMIVMGPETCIQGKFNQNQGFVQTSKIDLPRAFF